MRFLAIFIAVTAVVAIPLPQDDQPKEQPPPPSFEDPGDRARHWGADLREIGDGDRRHRGTGHDVYPEQRKEDLPEWTSGASENWSFQNIPDDPVGSLFDGLQQVADVSGSVLQKVPGLPQLGVAAGAAYTFFNPPAAPADASAAP